MKKPGLSAERHRHLELELGALHTYLVNTSTEVGAAYPKNGKASTGLDRMIKALQAVRNELDRLSPTGEFAPESAAETEARIALRRGAEAELNATMQNLGRS